MKRKRGLTPSPKNGFGAGLVTMKSKVRLKPGQLVKAKNVNLWIEGEAEVRGGCAKHSTVAFGSIIDRFIHFKTDTYDKLIAYGDANLKRLDVGSPDVWTSLSAGMPDTDEFRSMMIAKDMLFIGRTDERPAVYYPAEAGIWKAGIAAPSVKLTTNGGAPGNPDGTYQHYYTYYNSTTGWESDPSPISDEEIVNDAKIDISAFVASTESGVDKQRIYRNPNGVSDAFYYVGEKDNNTSGFEDNIHDDNLGLIMGWRNGLPPKAGILLYHMNRMFYVDAENPSTLWWSEPFKPNAVYEDNNYEVESGDGGRIIALAVSYDNIIVVKNTGIFTFLFNAMYPENSDHTVLSKRYGGNAAMSVDNIGEDVILLTSDGLKKIVNAGSQIQDVAIVVMDESGAKFLPPITSIFKDCIQSALSKAVGVYYEKKDQYHLSLPYYNSDNGLTLAWHRAANIFSTHEGWNVKANGLYRDYDSHLLYRSHKNQFIYKHDFGNDDDGAAIDYDLQNGWEDLDGIPDKKRARLMFISLFGEDGAIVNYELLKDFEISGKKRTITHKGASYWGSGYWGTMYWGATGEVHYRHRLRIIGRLFSTRFYGSTTKHIGISFYQLFYQPKDV